MKKTTLLLLLMGLLMQAYAQEKTKRHEIGLSLSDFNSFGVVYRFGTEKSLWRIATLETFIRRRETSTVNSVTKNKDTSYGLRIGKEFRTKVDEKYQFRWGFDVSYFFLKDMQDFDVLNSTDLDRLRRSTTHVIGVNAVLGMNFPISKRLLLGVEILPTFSYDFGNRYEEFVNPTFVNDIDHEDFQFRLSNDGAIIVFTYTL
ncbi:MAG: hypothetical protein R8G66_03445 [Cytophagales bacterium]|nr:hypothetical protein [Cytophagales bacterium]